MQTMREIKAALMAGHGHYDGDDGYAVRVRHVAGHRSGAAIGEWWGDWPRELAEHIAAVLAAEFGGTIHTDGKLITVLSGRGPGGRPPVGPLVSLRFPPALLDRLDAHARQTGTTRSALVREGAEQLLAGDPAPAAERPSGTLEMISMRLPTDLIGRLDAAARAAGTTRSALLRLAAERRLG
jgi:predicted DNA-binding protein